MATLLHTIVLLLFLLAPLHAIENGPIQLIPSTEFYGPDGPWQAVSVSLGNPPQNVNLLPGGVFESQILSNKVCSNQSLPQPCGAGGLYNLQNSDTVDNTSISFGGNADLQTLDGGATSAYGSSIPIMDSLNIPRIQYSPWVVPNFSITLFENLYFPLPDGSGAYPAELGTLSLGGNTVVNQSFGSGRTDIPAVNASLIPGWFLGQEKVISSASYGLHIGSAAMGIPLSLWLGGYDRSRVLGPVSSQPYAGNTFKIDLLDIGIGVDNGASPFNFPERQNILAQGNVSMGDATSVAIHLLAPYIHLPKSTCDAIASYLPVTFQRKYGLYTWNTKSPKYEPIVTSPSFLSFTFRASNINQANLTIKVPFQLLNLTLQAPIAKTPTQYFPCRPPPDGGSYTLGRAFLQAAFVGVIWDPLEGAWFLAQAPGPKTAITSQQQSLTKTVTSSAESWTNTWSGHWTPIKETTSTVNSTNTTEPSGSSATATAAATPASGTGLSTGAKAGIGAGCAVAGILLLGLAILFFRKRSHARLASDAASPNGTATDDHQRDRMQSYYHPEKPSFPVEPVEAPAPVPVPVEMTHREHFQELG